jgi:hypothetical protein
MNDVVSSKTRLLRLALSAVGFCHIYRLECGLVLNFKNICLKQSP